MSSMKIETLQYLRAYAAILVVLNHVWGKGVVSNTLGFYHIGGLGVDIFFIISGFIMCYALKPRYENKIDMSKDFIIRRILRIYPPYLILLIPFIFLYFAKCFFDGSEVSLIYIIKNMLLLPSFIPDANYKMFLSVSWTLVYEMFFYVIFAFAILFTASLKKTVLFFSTLIIGMVLSVNFLDIQGERLNWVNFTYMIGDPIMINFVIGSVLYFFFDKIKLIQINKYFSIFGILILTAVAMKLSATDYSRFISFSIPGTLIFLLTICMNVDKENKFISLLGDASYSIYLIHMLFALPSKKLAVMFAIPDLVGFVFAVLAIISGVIFYKKIEKPLTKWLYLKYKNKDLGQNKIS